MDKKEKIPTYVINLKERTDRLFNVKREFEGREEFDVWLVEGTYHENGNFGLFLTLKEIVKDAKSNSHELFILCEDDHYFTENYDRATFLSQLVEGKRLGADLLIGGSTGGYNIAIPINERLVWVDHYWSNQFLVLYSTFYDVILNDINFSVGMTIDNTLARFTKNKFILVPFISKQKVFGYSDVTLHNNLFPENIPERFDRSEGYLKHILGIFNKYICNK